MVSLWSTTRNASYAQPARRVAVVLHHFHVRLIKKSSSFCMILFFSSSTAELLNLIVNARQSAIGTRAAPRFARPTMHVRGITQSQTDTCRRAEQEFMKRDKIRIEKRPYTAVCVAGGATEGNKRPREKSSQKRLRIAPLEFAERMNLLFSRPKIFLSYFYLPFLCTTIDLLHDWILVFMNFICLVSCSTKCCETKFCEDLKANSLSVETHKRHVLRSHCEKLKTKYGFASSSSSRQS